MQSGSNDLTQKTLYSYMAHIGKTIGVGRSITQLPLTLGLTFHLIYLGYPTASAVSASLFWALALPNFVKFPMEFGFGFMADALGEKGAFFSLRWAYILRVFMVSFVLLGCLSSSPALAIALCCIGSLATTASLALQSGALADAYRKSAEFIDKKKLKSNYCQLRYNSHG